jgi:hypothetical protein
MLKRILILNCMLSLRVLAQVDTGNIVGTLHDPSGAAVPSATITIVEKSTNASTVVHSDDKGEYSSPPLHVGTYSVTAEAPGFKATTRDNLTLQVQDRLRIDFDMQVGQISEGTRFLGSPADPNGDFFAGAGDLVQCHYRTSAQWPRLHSTGDSDDWSGVNERQ